MGKAGKWLVGCGVGCGVVLLGLIVLAVMLGLFARDTMQGFEDAVEFRQQLEKRYGRTAEFVPPLDGAVPAARIERFIAVREASMPARDAAGAAFEEITGSEGRLRDLEEEGAWTKFRAVFGVVGSAMGLGAKLGDYFEARNRALVEHEMSIGEYAYLYTVIYHVWLRQDPEDGPRFSQEIQIDGSGSLVQQSRVRRDLRQMLRNQRDALAGRPDADAAWVETLLAQIEWLEDDPTRLPWQDGPPPQLAASLEPFREALTAGYRPATNPFELLENERGGSFNIKAR
jgi:hypothetical protein